MSDEQEQKDKKQRHRSPPYPSTSLIEAVANARTFYDAQKRNTVHFEAAMKSLGYQPKSSGGLRILASMIAFGLVEDEGTGGSRKVRLTDLGFKLMVLGDDDPDRLPLLQEAATRPNIYTQMLNQWSDGLPSDDAISKYLILERKYNPASVGELIKDFRATYEYAKLGSGTISTDPKDNGKKQDENDPPATDPAQSGHERGFRQSKPGVTMATLGIPVRDDIEAVLTYPADITSEELEDMVTYLDTFREVQSRKIKRAQAQGESESQKSQPTN